MMPKSEKMRIVCDTNVWYQKLSADKFKGMNLTLTFISAHELATTSSLSKKIEKPREVIQRMMTLPETFLLQEPFHFIAGIGDPEAAGDVPGRPNELLPFLAAIANGHEIDPTKKEDFEKWRKGKEDLAQLFADNINEELPAIRKNMRDPEAYKERSLANPIPFRTIVSKWVSNVVKKTYTVDDIDWDEFHLFDVVARNFFTKLETAEDPRAFQKNDFFDMFNLVYVSPRDMYWIPGDFYWGDLIEECGFGNILFSRKKR
jgi:hypothetical protein